ncbi:hypothetical protein CK501_12720 [Halovibrio salipaludis]|uniref:DUF4168 domain-containing protein n=1 Tax=Halovibrio salipaludis TaxID=2032626 RepID=A0A2A2F555_9GAMM|nr:DUF4168 domain-containing protein [Halovibrio salipaludis]PAU79663.1 hypothetical protein CK501_12720 [Halovibrio salipaludis]
MKLKTLTAAVAFALSTAGMSAVAQDYSSGSGAEGQGQQQQQQSQGQGQGQGMGAPEQQQNADFSDEELQNFVELQDKIGEVREDYVSQIESAESEDKARELQQKAQTEMVEVIEEEGMTVEEYNAIAVAYNSNPEIQERVDEMSE